jgi:hypothetical protein
MHERFAFRWRRRRLSAPSKCLRWKMASAWLTPSDLRWRNESIAKWLVAKQASGKARGGHPSDARLRKGHSVCCNTTRAFTTPTRNYFRFTRWRRRAPSR